MLKNVLDFTIGQKLQLFIIMKGIKPKEYITNSPHLPIPVCLVFDEELIYLDTTIFTDRNSGCSDVKLGDDYTFFNNIEWHKVFSKRYYYAREWRNKMQAELLSKIPVSLDYLKKIIFSLS